MLKRKVVVDYDDVEDVELEETNCCGIYELHDLSPSTVVNLVKIGENMVRDYPMIIFHDRISRKRGYKLANYIKSHNLGKVYASSKLENPNTKAKIQMWIFYPDWKEMDKYFSNVLIKDDSDWDDIINIRKPYRITHNEE